MTEIDVKGTIVSNQDKYIYTYLGFECTSPQDIQTGLKDANGDDVKFIINSGGGDVSAGNEIYYLISQYNGKTVADIVGFACSAASYLALAADKVRMVPSAAFMIHNVTTVAMGNSTDMNRTANTLKALDEGIAHVYAIKTGKSKEDILNLMENETWLNAAQALEMGFADEVINDQPVFANATTGMISQETKNKINKVLDMDNMAKNIAQSKLNLLKIKEAKK